MKRIKWGSMALMFLVAGISAVICDVVMICVFDVHSPITAFVGGGIVGLFWPSLTYRAGA